MARKESTRRRVKHAKRSMMTNVRNLARRNKSRNGNML